MNDGTISKGLNFMKTVTAITLTLSTLSLLACSEVDLTQSEFVTLASDGSMDTGLDDVRYSEQFTDGTGNGYTVEIGVDEGLMSGGFRASVGMLPSTSMGDLPGASSVVFSGSYNLAHMERISSSFPTIVGYRRSVSGPINLTADFAAGTLSGAGTYLDVNGTFDDTNLNGTVTYTYSDLTGELDGTIGGDGAVGIFHGHTDDEIFAGGFIVD